MPTTSATTTSLTSWQRTILAAVAAGQVTMVTPIASKPFADWYRPDEKPRHRSPTHTVNQLLDLGLIITKMQGDSLICICTRKGNAALRAIAATVS